MNDDFFRYVEDLHPFFEELVGMPPRSTKEIPTKTKLSGVYLFSEGSTHLYVGRSRNIRRRYMDHTRVGALHNQASFAFLIARKVQAKQAPSYRSDELSREGLSKNPAFAAAFTAAKTRVGNMDLRFIEQGDSTKQALLEIYCSIALDTEFNEFKTH